MSEFDNDLVVDESNEEIEVDVEEASPLAKRRLIENRLEEIKLQRELDYYDYFE